MPSGLLISVNSPYFLSLIAPVTDENHFEKRVVVMIQAIISLLELPLLVLAVVILVWHALFKGFRIAKLISQAYVTT